jgi:phthalate 4,5-dioxygenase
MKREDNEALTRVEPGSPMSRLCKHYWMPACLASDLVQGGDPFRVRLLGQDYVGFRDAAGQVGILDELCPHRRASLMLGRVRENTIECIYHGWQFSTSGAIEVMPNCQDEGIRERYRATAYPVHEAGGMVWVYLGDLDAEGRPPAFPLHRWMSAPANHKHPRIVASRSNFVQVMEGLLDSSHLAVLHQDSLPRPDGSVKVVNETMRPASRFTGVMSAKAPKLEIEDTSFGVYAAALREIVTQDGRSQLDVRVTAYVAPFTVYVANGNVTLMCVPVDTETTYLYIIYWDPDRPFAEPPYSDDIEEGTGTRPDVAARFGFTRESLGQPGTASRANNWMQDRAAMRRGETFSGLPPFSMEDIACTTSMGAVSDRQEMLVPADLAIVRMRRYLLNAARDVAAGGDAPHFADAQLAGRVGAIFAQMNPGERWQDLLPSAEAASVAAA